jgi:hypothetical protein
MVCSTPSCSMHNVPVEGSPIRYCVVCHLSMEPKQIVVRKQMDLNTLIRPYFSDGYEDEQGVWHAPFVVWRIATLRKDMPSKVQDYILPAFSGMGGTYLKSGVTYMAEITSCLAPTKLHTAWEILACVLSGRGYSFQAIHGIVSVE